MPTKTPSPTVIGKKKCTNCKKSKTMDTNPKESGFYKNASLKNHALHQGYAMWCKDCDRAGKAAVAHTPEPDGPISEPSPEVTPVPVETMGQPYIPTNAEAIRMALGLAEGFRKDMDVLKSESDILKAESTRKHETIVRLTSEIKRLKDNLESKPEVDETAWRQRLSEQQSHIDTLTAQVQQLKTDLENTKQIEALALKENQELNDQLSELRQTLDLREMRIRELEAQHGADDAPINKEVQGGLNALLAARGSR